MATLLNLSILLILALALLAPLFIQGTLGEITCEQLNKEDCAFAVSSTGKRCVLETYLKRSGVEAYKCTTSAIEADKLKDMVESNHCIEACGLDRDTLGISSDSLLESRFTQKLCSPQCYNKCPNVIDLYFNLAAGEGVYLPQLCGTEGKNPRRGMSEIKSSGIAALGPVSGENFLGAPVESPISSTEYSDVPVESPTDYPVESPVTSFPTDYPFYSPVVSPSPSIEFTDTPAKSPMNYPIYPPITSPISEFPDTPAESPINYPFYPPITSPISEVPDAPTESPTTYPPVESPTSIFPPIESPTTSILAPALPPYYF